MKPYFRKNCYFLLSLSVLLFFGCAGEYNLIPPNTRVVILQVDSEKLAGDSTRSLKLDNYCSFVGQNSETLMDHLTEVDKGDQLVWVVVDCSGKLEDLKVTEILVPNDSTEVNVLKEKSNTGHNGNVVAYVKKRGINPGDVTKYILKFEYTFNGKPEKREIDPKLKVL